VSAAVVSPQGRAALARILASPPPVLTPGQLAIETGPRIGSVCTGYGGLDEAVLSVLGGTLAWVSDPDDGPARILAHHHPDTPNLGDLRFVHWARARRQYGLVDVLIGGYPCQPFSVAGPRKGTADARHIWPYIATAIRVLRPRLCLFENVAGHVRLGLDAVLADLANLGFDAEWIVVPASDVGATHQRKRVFLLAVAQDADRTTRGQWGFAAPGQAESRRARPDARGRGGAPVADAERLRLQGQQRDAEAPAERETAASVGRGTARSRATVADSQGAGRPRPRVRGSVAERGSPDWGPYAPAIARWEAATGRLAPWATDHRGRLAPEFVEWMMGLPAGHVTAVPGLSHVQQIKALGNGVVPQQAAYALRLLLDRAGLAHLIRRTV
jgi:DNA (cytosine-5)-methyltransferase 1